MRESVLSERVGNYRINVYYDYDCDNPRTDWDCNASHMVVQSRSLAVEDDDIEGILNGLCLDYGIDNTNMGFLETIEALNEFIVIKPISKYEHSGITVWYGHPNCDWDSGFIGFGYMEHADVMECGRNGIDYPNWRDQAEELMQGEMEDLDRVCRGEVFGYVIEELEEPSEAMKLTDGYDEERWEEDERNWSDYDSCWGFYMDAEDVMKEAKSCLPQMEEVAVEA